MVIINALKTSSPRSISVNKSRIVHTDPSIPFKPIYGAEIREFSNTVYFKGPAETVIKGYKDRGVTLDSNIEKEELSHRSNAFSFANIAKHLLHTAIRLKMQKMSYLQITKRIPGFQSGKFSESVMTRLIRIKDTGSAPFVCQGFSFQIDPRSDNSVYLWIDTQTHMAASESSLLTGKFGFKDGENRFRILTRKERDSRGLTSEFLRISKISPLEYFGRLQQFINDLSVVNGKPSIEFSDNERIEFNSAFSEFVPIGIEKLDHDTITVLDFPKVKFEQGNYISSFSGLLNDAPYRVGSLRKAKILVMYDERREMQVRQFWDKLTKEWSRWRGFVGTFGVYLDAEMRKYRADNATQLLDAVTETAKTSKNIDLMLLIGQDDFVNTIYYDAKRIFWGSGFISQLLLINTIQKIIANDIYTTMNLATGMFVKLGGIPWIISDISPQSNTGFLGLGFTKEASGTDIHYGVAYLFDKRGYTIDVFVENFSPDIGSPKDIKRFTASGYFLPHDKMIDLLTRAIRKLREYNNLETDNPVTLIVHKSAIIHDEEEYAAQTVAASMNATIYLVHVEESNVYRGFDDIGGQRSDAFRGTYYCIDDSRGLLWTAGSRRDRGETKLHHPVEVNVHNVSTPPNVTPTLNGMKIAEQIYGLTLMDWSSGNLRRMPATILYAREAARLLRHSINLSAQNWSLVI